MIQDGDGRETKNVVMGLWSPKQKMNVLVMISSYLPGCYVGNTPILKYVVQLATS
jgi:hypothetical protein